MLGIALSMVLVVCLLVKHGAISLVTQGNEKEGKRKVSKMRSSERNVHCPTYIPFNKCTQYKSSLPRTYIPNTEEVCTYMMGCKAKDNG